MACITLGDVRRLLLAADEGGKDDPTAYASTVMASSVSGRIKPIANLRIALLGMCRKSSSLRNSVILDIGSAGNTMAWF